MPGAGCATRSPRRTAPATGKPDQSPSPIPIQCETFKTYYMRTKSKALTQTYYNSDTNEAPGSHAWCKDHGISISFGVHGKTPRIRLAAEGSSRECSNGLVQDPERAGSEASAAGLVTTGAGGTGAVGVAAFAGAAGGLAISRLSVLFGDNSLEELSVRKLSSACWIFSLTE